MVYILYHIHSKMDSQKESVWEHDGEVPMTSENYNTDLQYTIKHKDIQSAVRIGQELVRTNEWLSTKLTSQQTTIDDQYSQIQDLTRKYNDLNRYKANDYNELEKTIHSLEKNNSNLEEKQRFQEKTIKTLQWQNEDLKTKCEELQNANGELRQGMQSLQDICLVHSTPSANVFRNGKLHQLSQLCKDEHLDHEDVVCDTSNSISDNNSDGLLSTSMDQLNLSEVSTQTSPTDKTERGESIRKLKNVVIEQDKKIFSLEEQIAQLITNLLHKETMKNTSREEGGISMKSMHEEFTSMGENMRSIGFNISQEVLSTAIDEEFDESMISNVTDVTDSPVMLYNHRSTVTLQIKGSPIDISSPIRNKPFSSAYEEDVEIDDSILDLRGNLFTSSENKATQTDNHTRILIYKIDECHNYKLSVYDDANPDDTRFKNPSKFSKLFKKIFADLKKITEDDGGNEKLFSTEEMSAYSTDKNKTVDVAERIAAVEQVIRKSSLTNIAEVKISNNTQDVKSAVNPNDLIVLTPYRRPPLEYITVGVHVRKKASAKKISCKQGNKKKSLTPPMTVQRRNTKKRFDNRQFASRLNETEISFPNLSSSSPTGSASSTLETTLLKKSRNPSQGLEEFKKLDLTYAEVLKNVDKTHKPGNNMQF